VERELRKKRERARPVSCPAGGERVRVRGGVRTHVLQCTMCYLLLSATPPPMALRHQDSANYRGSMSALSFLQSFPKLPGDVKD